MESRVVKNCGSIAAVCAALIGSASAEVFVKPGDSSFIEYPIEHFTDSAADIENLELSVVAPAHFVVKATSIKGPFTLSPGQTKTFRIDYEIAAGADEGPFNVELNFTSTTEDVDPKLASLDTSVNNNIADPHFLVGDEKLIFSKRRTPNGRNPAFSGIHHSETHARSITASGLLAGVRV